jgi:BirA family biotin operon repressor/biotin-[acetyl-CoA-carboxylase] ligase
MVKWPNDIMIRAATTGAAQTTQNAQPAKKAAGILAEAYDGGIVFIGIGINVAQKEFPASLRDKATSISLASGIDISPEARFALLEKILSRLYGELEPAAPVNVAAGKSAGGGKSGNGANADWRCRLEERLYKKGGQVCFAAGAAGSDRIVEGRLEGIGAGGELLITPCGESEERAFVTGELRVY